MLLMCPFLYEFNFEKIAKRNKIIHATTWAMYEIYVDLKTEGCNQIQTQLFFLSKKYMMLAAL